ncbi:MAG: FAD-dependent oxidoreductase [Burkholderiaceae bacterium]
MRTRTWNCRSWGPSRHPRSEAAADGWLPSIGGFEIRHEHALGGRILLDDLCRDCDALFRGIGLGGVNALGLADERVGDLGNAIAFIAGLRQASDYATLPVGRRVVVLGGGMTAVHAAVQSMQLGAEEVTIVYRRDQQRMSASRYEQQWAQLHGGTIRTFSGSMLSTAHRATSNASRSRTSSIATACSRTPSPHWTTSASTSAKASSSRCSGRPAAARRRYCG